MDNSQSGHELVDLTSSTSTRTAMPGYREQVGGATGGVIRRNQSGARVSRIVFTLNNWTQLEYDDITNNLSSKVKWMVVGKETGALGTKHLQGACILGSQWSFSKLKTLTGLKRAHIECMRGKPEDSLVYCTKEDSDAFVCGTLPAPGMDIWNWVIKTEPR